MRGIITSESAAVKDPRTSREDTKTQQQSESEQRRDVLFTSSTDLSLIEDQKTEDLDLDASSKAWRDPGSSKNSLLLLKEMPRFIAEEKERIRHILQMMIAQSPSKEEISTHEYKDADQAWVLSRQAWEERSQTAQKLETQEKIFQEAEELLKKVREARDQIEADKTVLGRIAQVAQQSATPLSFIPGPVPCGGIAHTVAAAADGMNQIWINKDIFLAEGYLSLTTRQKESAAEKLEMANSNVRNIREQAQQIENRARLLITAAHKAATEQLKPPITSFHDADWNTWATRIIQVGQGDTAFIPLLANHGISDPLWAADIVAKALRERSLENFQTEKRKLELQLFEQAFQTASQAFQQANKRTTHLAEEVNKARERLESATQLHHYWKSELKNIDAALNELEKPENARKPNNAHNIGLQQKAFTETLTQFEKACRDLKTCEEVLSQAYDRLNMEEANSVPLRNEVTATEEALQRNKERILLHQESISSFQPQVTLRLPRVIEEGTTLQQLEELEKVGSTLEAEIEPPEMLDKVYETMGSAFLNTRQEKTEDQLDLVPTTAHRFIPEIREPTPEDLARWEASHQAEEFIEERNNIIAHIQRRSPSILSQAREERSSRDQARELTQISEEEEEAAVFNEATSQEPSNHDGTSFVPKALTRNKFKSQSSRASTTSVHTKSERSENSIGSFISNASIHSWTGSVAGSLPASISTTANKQELKKLKKAIHSINKAATTWAELVRKADAERIAAGGIPYPDEETLFDAWQNADTMAEAAWKRRCSLQEEALRSAAMAQEWEANTLRWEARAEADRLASYQEEAQNDLVTLAENQNPLDANWNSRYQVASDHLQQIEKIATDAQKKWFRLAELETSIQKTQNPEEKKKALKKLREKDQAIVALWERVREDYHFEKDYESGGAQRARLAQEKENYQFDLITEKTSTIARCFAQADVAYHQTQQRDTLLEQASIKDYTEATLQEALKAAREQISGAAAAWEVRVKRAQKEAQDIEVRTRTIDSRLLAIAEADKKALEAFESEAKEFADIEAIWRAQLQAEEESAITKRLEAVRNYQQGNRNAWHALIPQERGIYNEAVIAANEALVDDTERRLGEVLENTHEQHHKATKAWRAFSKKSAQEKAQQAVSDLIRFKTQEENRRIAIRWAKLWEFQNYANQEKDSSIFDLATMDTKNLRARIERLSNIAERAWNEAKAFCDDLDITWARKAEVVQAGYQLASEHVKKVEKAWKEFAEKQRTILEQTPQEHQDFETLMIAATADLIHAGEKQYYWNAKDIKAERMAQTALDPFILEAKSTFEEMRMAWEGLHYFAYHENPEAALQMVSLIKTQAEKIAEVNSDIQIASMNMSTTAEALAELIVAARNHARFRVAGAVSASVTGTTVSAGIGIGVFASAGVASGALAIATLVASTGGIAAIPIITGAAAYCGYRYYKTRNNPNAPLLSPLAPRTTQIAREVLEEAKLKIEAAANSSVDTIWATEIAWCHRAVEEATAFVNTIIHAAPVLKETE